MQGKPKRNLFSFTPTQFSDYKNNYKLINYLTPSIEIKYIYINIYIAEYRVTCYVITSMLEQFLKLCSKEKL